MHQGKGAPPTSGRQAAARRLRPPRVEPRPAHRSEKPKAKRKFAYRKAVEIEREIGELEDEVAELEDLLGQPATWRDPVKAVGFQDRHTRAQSPSWKPCTSTGRPRSKPTGK